MKIKKDSKLFRLLTFTLAFIIIISGGTLSAFAVASNDEVDTNTISTPEEEFEYSLDELSRQISLVNEIDSETIYVPEEESESSSDNIPEQTYLLDEIDSETVYVPEEESESSSDEISGNISSGDMTDIISPGGNVAEINGIGDDSLYQPIYSSGTYVIEDGVYAFENVGNVGLWMDTQYSKKTPGYHMQQYALTEDPTVAFTRPCLFKITRISDTNRYIIRSMLNNRMTFGFTGDGVFTKQIPPNDADVAVADTFTITYQNGYVVLKPYGSSYAVAANNTTASGASGAPNSYLAQRTEADAGTRARWYMHKYTGGTYSGMNLIATPSFANGDSVAVDTASSIELITWTTEIGKNTPYLQVHPDSIGMATSTWNANTNKMTLSTQKVGPFKLRAIIRADGTTTSFRSYACYYTIVPDIDGKTICVMNAGTGRYFDIEGNYTSSGADIQQYDFTGGATLFWTATLGNNGYFSIKSNYSNKYIGVESTNTTLVRQYSTQSDYTLWKFIETTAGNYKLVCKAIESSGLALAVPLNANSNGTDLNMITYTDDTNYRDEWKVYANADTSNEDFSVGVGYQEKFNFEEVTNFYPATATYFTYTILSGTDIVSVNNSTGTFTGLKVGTAVVKATHKSKGKEFLFKINVVKNAIIIVPGIMGTELVAGDNNAYYSEGTDLWSTALLNESFEPLEIANRIVSLRCDSNGNSVNDIVVRSNKYGADNTYKVLYDYLEKEHGSKYTIEFFAYDWRLSNAISATSLNTFINNKEYDNVILICHSMGGLVASSYLSLGASQRNKVDKVITLGSPLLGTSVMPYLWGSEDINVTGLLNDIGLPNWSTDLIDFVTLYYDVLDMFLGNFKSLYEMFPSKEYFDTSYAGKSYLVTSILGTGDLEVTTYSETMERLESYLAYYNTDHIDSAESFHSSLYSGSTHMTELVTTYYIAGYNVSTIDKVEYNMWDWSVYTNTMYGDSLVATWSATLGDRNSNRTFYASNVGHIGLVKNTQLTQFVAKLISGNTSVIEYSDIHANIQ